MCILVNFSRPLCMSSEYIYIYIYICYFDYEIIMTFLNFNTIDYFLQGNIIKIHIEKYLNLYNFLI